MLIINNVKFRFNFRKKTSEQQPNTSYRIRKRKGKCNKAKCKAYKEKVMSDPLKKKEYLKKAMLKSREYRKALTDDQKQNYREKGRIR